MSIRRHKIIVFFVVCVLVFSQCFTINAQVDKTDLKIFYYDSHTLYDGLQGDIAKALYVGDVEFAKNVYNYIESMNIDYSKYDDVFIWYRGAVSGEVGKVHIDLIKEADCFACFTELYPVGSDMYNIRSDGSLTNGGHGYCQFGIFSQGSYDEYQITIDSSGKPTTHSFYTNLSLNFLGGTPQEGLFTWQNSLTGSPNYHFALLYSTIPVYSSYDFSVQTGNSNVSLSTPYINRAQFVDSIPNMTDYSKKGYAYGSGGSGAIGVEPKVDNTIGFEDFVVRRCFDSSVKGGSSALVTYSVPQEILDFSTGEGWYIHYDVRFECLFVRSGDSWMSVIDENYFEELFYYNFEYDSPIITSSSGSGTQSFDLVSLMEEYGYPDDYLAAYIKCLNEYTTSHNAVWEWATSYFGGMFGAYEIIDPHTYYSVKEMDVSIEAYLCNASTNRIGRTSYGYVDLIGGENQSLVNQGYEDEPIKNDVVHNMPDVKPKMESDGSVVYVDASSGNIENNNSVLFPSTLTLKFANALELEGMNINNSSSSSGGSGGSGGGYGGDNINLTIEDDDYTDTSLREDLRDGFGLLDNMDTDENSDGFLQLSAGFFEHLDGDLDDILVFGMSSVVVISILRSVFRR